MSRSLPCLAAAFCALLVIVSCGSDAPKILGEAYVAPASLNLHSNLGLKSNTVAVLKHGDHLRVVDTKRRYVKVLTDKGVHGWLDSRELLTKDQMAQLRREAEEGLLMPSQGSATVFDPLNIHIEPERYAPAFAQIPPNGLVQVLAHRATPRTMTAPSSSVFTLPRPAPPPTRRSRRAKAQKSFRPPMPPAPKLPPNWQELSAEHSGSGQESADEAKKKAPVAEEKPVILEDWSLVRTSNKQVGWALSRNLYMAIPEEVMQYAEGQRITSYFDLGPVVDEVKGVKHNWLWTTSSRPQPFEFDRFRVFYWNRRRHRYETSYRAKDLIGYFPIEVEPAQTSVRSRYFSLILQDDAGNYWKKRYVFDGALVHLVSSDPYQPPPDNPLTKAPIPSLENAEFTTPRAGWIRRQALRLRHFFRHR
jgi:hypothetical protein